MTREKAIHKMEYSKRAYQMLIDEKVQEGVLVGHGINAEWSADTPIIDAYKDMLEACDMAIKALEQEPILDKIRAWIDKPVIRDEYSQRQNDYCDGYEFVCNQIREIVDTYKAESPTDTWSIKDVADTLAKHGLIVEQEPCGDVISRQAVLNKILKFSVTDGRSVSVTGLWTEVNELPSVNPQEPKTGHWEWVQYDYNPKLGDWHCSECRSVVIECVYKNEKAGIPLYKYCPQCGTKMVEPQESEEV